MPALIFLAACAHPGDPEVSRGYTHDNLTVYIISSEADRSGPEYLTLEEGLRRELVVLTEAVDGGQVPVLHVENRSDLPLFIPGGQIAVGGNQDRAIAADCIVPPRSKRAEVSVFCVEPDRWSPRVETDASGGSAISGAIFEIDSEPTLLPTRALRLAALREADQSRVWDEVSEFWALSGSAQEDDASSLAAALADPKLRAVADAAVERLSRCILRHPRAVGVAVAIDGTLQYVDRYESPGLFRSLYPTLLRSAAIEAAVRREGSYAGGAPASSAVRDVVDRMRTDGWEFFETCDATGGLVHVQAIRED